MLSDKEILKAMEKGDIKITDFKRENLGCNSYDLTLFHKIKKFSHNNKKIDVARDIPKYDEIELPIVVSPQEFYIIMSNEKVYCSEKYLGIISLRSNLSRLPLLLAGSMLLDSGYFGTLTKGLYNLSSDTDFILKPDIRFCQILFCRVDGEIDTLYTQKKSAKNLSQDLKEVPGYKIDKK